MVAPPEELVSNSNYKAKYKVHNKLTPKMIGVLGALIIFVMSVGVAMASIARGYAGPFPDQYTVESGTLFGDYDGNNDSYGTWSSFHWRQNGTNWINAHIDQVGPQRNKVAIVWHSQQKNGANCGGLEATNWLHPTCLIPE